MLPLALLALRWTMRLPDLPGNVSLFNQTLDHFDADSDEVFPQRYILNDDHCAPDCETSSPIVLYISGEAAMNGSRTPPTPVVDLAGRTRARLASLEHRFYGESAPRDLTPGNLSSLLTTPQALADLAAFVDFLKGGNGSRAVVVAGGSYAGTLASYFRQTYPHAANASWASSAPLHLTLNFTEYDSHCADVLYEQSPKCYDNSRALMDYFHGAISNATELADVRRHLGLNRSTDAISLLETVADQLAGMIQYRSRDGGATLARYCANQSGEAYSLADFYAWFAADNPAPDDDDALLLTDARAGAPLADARAWTWQTCNEFGWFQTASGRLRSPFLNLSYWERVCAALFGATLPAQADMRRRFGDRAPAASNTVFVNGDVDPWSTLGVERAFACARFNAFSVRVSGGSHCSELSPSPSDTQEILAKRELVVDTLVQLLRNATTCVVRCHPAHGHCELGRCVCAPMWTGDACDQRQIDAIIFQVSAAALVVLPAVMMIIIGYAAWFLFQKEVTEPDIGIMGTLGMS
jgi:serine protease 16